MAERAAVQQLFLVTFHGWMVGRDLRALPISEFEAGSALEVEIPAEWLASDFAAFVSIEADQGHTVELHGLGRFRMRRSGAGRSVTFERDGTYLCAEKSGHVYCNRSKASLWETFQIISSEDASFLKKLLHGHYLLESARTVGAPGDWRIAPGPSLAFQASEFPLDRNLPLDLRFAPHRVVVYRDGWKFDQIICFSPLIFYVAFGENTLLQLCISIDSLYEIGGYTGLVHVFTDLSRAELLGRLTPKAEGRITTSAIPAQDWVGYVAGKYSILEHAPAWNHSPVVYMDPDIVYNTDVQPLLIDMVSANRLTAPLEEFSPLARARSVGAQLLQMDNEEPRLTRGMNFGTFAVPNLLEFSHYLDVVRRTIKNYIATNHRESLSWVDQEAANYIAYKYSGAETSRVSRYVKYGNADDARSVTHRTGLIHFWRVPRKDRVKVMRDYLDLLISADAIRAKQPAHTPDSRDCPSVDSKLGPNVASNDHTVRNS